MKHCNPYAKYNNDKILTATSAELTLMLYEGAIKFCNLAKFDIEKEEYGDSINNIQKARKIIAELQSNLNFDYPVAKDFDMIYCYIFQLMIDVNQDHSLDTMEEILFQLRDLRDIWKKVMNQGKKVVL